MKVLFHIRNSESIGIEFLMAMLKQDGHDVDLAFDCGVGDQDIRVPCISRFLAVKKTLRHKVRTFQPDLIASCVYTNTWKASKEVFSLFRGETSAPTVAGGPHATAAPEEILACSDADAVCMGESDLALREFCSEMQSNKISEDIQNFFIKKNGRIIKNPLRPLISNLDNLPFPHKEPFFQRGAFHYRSYSMTQRGCPFHCEFCSFGYYQSIYRKISPKYVRRNSVEWVIEMCKKEKKDYPIREFMFLDPVFIWRKDDDWIEKFAERYEQEVALPYKVLLRSGTFNRASLERMKRSGLLYLDIGVEAGNERVRMDVLGKKIDNETIRESCKIVKEAGIVFSLLLMVGCPGETPEEMKDTYRLVMDVKPNGIVMHYFYPFIKTSMWERTIKEGWIRDDNELLFREGKGGYRQSDTLLHSPHKKESKKWFVYLPICLKLPRQIHAFILMIPPITPFRVLSSFCTSVPRNLWIRFYEFNRMIYKQLLYSLELFIRRQDK